MPNLHKHGARFFSGIINFQFCNHHHLPGGEWGLRGIGEFTPGHLRTRSGQPHYRSRTDWLQVHAANHDEKPALNFSVSLPSKWGGNRSWRFSQGGGATFVLYMSLLAQPQKNMLVLSSISTFSFFLKSCF